MQDKEEFLKSLMQGRAASFEVRLQCSVDVEIVSRMGSLKMDMNQPFVVLEAEFLKHRYIYFVMNLAIGELLLFIYNTLLC